MRAIGRALPLVLLALSVSCGDSTRDGPSGAVPSAATATYDGSWELSQGRAPEGPIEIGQSRRITLTIDGENFGGLSSCNHYGATANVQDEEISIKGVGGTEIGCEPDVAETEARYYSALVAAETIERTGDELIIAGGCRTRL